MKRILSVVFSVQLLLGGMLAHAQLWNGDLTFTSQQQIDDFGNYSYVSVSGDLIINDAGDGVHDIKNLAGLAGLRSISGTVYVINNNLLTNTNYLNVESAKEISISGNAALTEISNLPLIAVSSGIRIESNNSLTRISGFGPLKTINVQLIVQSNPQLTSLSGFAGVEKVIGSLILGSNNSLTNLNAFSNLQECKALIIRNNALLGDINGLIHMTRVSQLEISNNALLSNIDGLTSLVVADHSIKVTGNNSLLNINGLSHASTSSVVLMQISNNRSLQSVVGGAAIKTLGGLNITDNPSLTSVSGFSNLSWAGFIAISKNKLLKSVTGFQKLETLTGSLLFEEDDNLITINAFTKLASIGGDLRYENVYPLSDIMPMPLLDTIGGTLGVLADTLLASLHFVPNLRSAGNILLAACNRLNNIQGLRNLRSVSGDLTVLNCPGIADLGSLSNLTAIGNSLSLTQLPELKNLSGLHNISTIGADLTLVGCSTLTDINALYKLDSVMKYLNISYNPLLTNLYGLSNLRMAAQVVITDNAMLADFCGLHGLYVGAAQPGFTLITKNKTNPTAAEIVGGGACVALPVNFVLFNLTCETNAVVLKWITAGEYNNSRFVVQRSSNGTVWTNLSTVPGAGNSGVSKTYTFTDHQPIGNGFYRLAQYDVDGQVRYSSIVTSTCAIPTDIAIGPNPASDKVFVRIPATVSSQGFIRMYDSQGRLVSSRPLLILPGTNYYDVNMSTMAQGIYMLQVSYDGKELKKSILVLKR